MPASISASSEVANLSPARAVFLVFIMSVLWVLDRVQDRFQNLLPLLRMLPFAVPTDRFAARLPPPCRRFQPTR
ncbi:MAG: hypothetical protein ACOYO0_12590 [Sandarakinorhabdus sp.]